MNAVRLDTEADDSMGSAVARTPYPVGRVAPAVGRTRPKVEGP
jgi:hypothetical protein